MWYCCSISFPTGNPNHHVRRSLPRRMARCPSKLTSLPLRCARMLNSDVALCRSRLALTYVRQVTHVLHRQVSQLPSMESKRALRVGRFRSRRPAGVLFLIHNASCLNLQSMWRGLCVSGQVHSEASEARQRKLFAGDDDFKVRNNLSFSLSQSLYLVLTFSHLLLCLYSCALWYRVGSNKKDPSFLYAGAVVRVV